MVFLQSYMLLALPLIALPVLIHLINQHRHRTVHWAATRFLLQAKRTARGMARLRYLCILLARMLAVGGLIMAVARPMAAGWLGLAAGAAPELTVVILDRSASMEQQHPQSGRSKRATALRRISGTLTATGRTGRIVVFETATGRKVELTSVADLPELPEAAPTDTAANLPAILLAAVEYLHASAAGRVDLWICSDLRRTDWNPGSGLWTTVRQRLADRRGWRVHVLTCPEVSEDNLAASVSNVRRRESEAGAELILDLLVTKSGESAAGTVSAGSSPAASRVPLTIEIAGARSVLDVELTGTRTAVLGHSIPIDRGLKRGWGKIELPGDDNPADNSWSFVFAEPAPRRTWIVSDSPKTAELFRLAAGISAERDLLAEATVLAPEHAAQIDWTSAALVIWQAPLPLPMTTGTFQAIRDSAGIPVDGHLVTRQMETFVARGGSVLFFPPEGDADTTARIFGAGWGTWHSPPSAESFTIRQWRLDSDLLASAESGIPLPVGQLLVHRSREIVADRMMVLAQLEQGPPLLVRIPTDCGQVWFCSTLPEAASSNMATNGVTFYVMIQRALTAAQTGDAMHLECGASAAAEAGRWKPLNQETSRVPLSRRGLVSGVFERPDHRLVALHRPLSEDPPDILSDSALDEVLQGLEYTRIEDSAGLSDPLVSDVWRVFLGAMLCGLLVEAGLCVPSGPARLRAGASVQRVPKSAA